MAGKIAHGVLAGAAGTTALNAVTYFDMVLRGRSASSTPEQTVERVERLSGTELPGSRDTVASRRSGLGALLGIAAGLATGAFCSAFKARMISMPLPLSACAAGLMANVAGTAPMAALGVTDPRTWPVESWAMDLVPHLAYGLATAATFRGLTR